MTLFVGKKLKCIAAITDFEIGKKYIVDSIIGDTYIISAHRALSKNDVEKFFKGLKIKKVESKEKVKDIEIKEKKKRVLFPWMKCQIGRCYKAMLCITANNIGWTPVLKGNVAFNAHIKEVVNEVNKIFMPTIFETVKEFYHKKGRILTEQEFAFLCIGRIMMMFKFNRAANTIEKLPEHIENCKDKYNNEVSICNQILKAKSNYAEFKK